MVFVGAAAAARCAKAAVITAHTKGEISGTAAHAEPTAAVARVHFAERAEGGLVDVPGASRSVASLGKSSTTPRTVLAVMRVADGRISPGAVSSDTDMLVLFVDDHSSDDAEGGDDESVRTKDGSLRLDTRLRAPVGRLELFVTLFGSKKHLLTAGYVDITAHKIEANEKDIDAGDCILYRIVPKANASVPRRKVLLGGAAKAFEVQVCGRSDDAGAEAMRKWLGERCTVTPTA